MAKIILLVIIGLLAAGVGFLAVKDIRPPQQKVVKEIPLKTAE